MPPPGMWALGVLGLALSCRGAGAFVMHMASSCSLAANGSEQGFDFTLAFNKQQLVCYAPSARIFYPCHGGLLQNVAIVLAIVLNNSTLVQRAEARAGATWGRCTGTLHWALCGTWHGDTARGIGWDIAPGSRTGGCRERARGNIAQGNSRGTLHGCCKGTLHGVRHKRVAWGHAGTLHGDIVHGIGRGIARGCHGVSQGSLHGSIAPATPRGGKGTVPLPDCPLLAPAPPQLRVVPTPLTNVPDAVLLTCHVWGFYPPEVSIQWLHGGDVVASGDTAKLLPAGDWTYQTQVDLRTTAKTGDTYTCLVQHASLEQPLRESWSPGLSREMTVMVAVAGTVLAVGLVVLAAGVFVYCRQPRAEGPLGAGPAPGSAPHPTPGPTPGPAPGPAPHPTPAPGPGPGPGPHPGPPPAEWGQAVTKL
eukprot:XP_027303940.1 HLA class II histocompatibility antigen, DM beta chain-like [Anas platyrhynchos]